MSILNHFLSGFLHELTTVFDHVYTSALRCFCCTLLCRLFFSVRRECAPARYFSSIGSCVQQAHFGILISLSSSGCTVPSKRLIFDRERSSGSYSVSAFYWGLTVSDFPVQLLLPTLSTVLVYWTVGLQNDVCTFPAYLWIEACPFFLRLILEPRFRRLLAFAVFPRAASSS